MYASGSSNCFADISNFQELRFTAPATVQELDTVELNEAADSLAAHVSLHFSSPGTSPRSSSTNHTNANASINTSVAPASTINGYRVPVDDVVAVTCLLPDKAIAYELPKSPDDQQYERSYTPPAHDLGASDTGVGPPAKQAKGPIGRKQHGDARVCCFSLPVAEELLGSVTTFYPSGDPENGQTLRTSARVKYKMRMDSIRSSTPPLAERKDPAKPLTSTLSKTPSQPKQMRVVWSNHDKNLFFEALNEYGKDFEAILNYLNTKKRRKDNGEQQVFKSKDVRNLYYQFNQKVMKYVHFSDEVRKEVQELYALINYGEMRRKVPFQNKKYFHKLKDLVYKGFTTVREKGKNIRIKTPPCRALRKLNQLEEWQEEIKLPAKVDVLLKPSSMEAWGRVQSLAQNPRVRITVTIQKRLSALLQLFQQKWRAQDVRLVDRLDEMKRLSGTVSSKIMRQRLQHEIQLFSQVEIGAAGAPLLRFVPAQNVVIHRPMISLTDFQSNTSICLNSYEQRIGVAVSGETLCTGEKLAGGCKERLPATGRRQRTDSSSEKVGNESKKLKYDDGGKEPGDERPPYGLELLPQDGPAFAEHFKSPNASNESIEMKDFLGYDGEHCGPSRAADCDVLLGAGRQSDNSSDGFALLDGELLPGARYHQDTAESSAGEEPVKSSVGEGSGAGGTEMGSSSEQTCVTTVTVTTTTTTTATTTTTVTLKKKKKYHRRKGEMGKPNAATLPSANQFRPLVTEEQMQRIRDGWTLGSVGDLTVGDLYIMFGAEMKVELEYDWVREETVQRAAPVVLASEMKVCLASQGLSSVEERDSPRELVDDGKPTCALADQEGRDLELPPSAVDEELQEATVSVKEEVKETRGCPVDTISQRLKHLLFLASLANKDTKKRTANGAAERKPKRAEGDGGIMSTQDDCLQFKHPMLPVRNPINHLVPDLHVPPRYKQSRWWRSRVNRQTLHPLLPNMVRVTPSATVTSAASFSSAAASPGSSQVATSHTAPVVPAAPIVPVDADGVESSIPAEPLKQQEQHQQCGKLSQQPAPERTNVVTFDELTLPNDLTSYTHPTSSITPTPGMNSSSTVPPDGELNTPVKKLTGEVLPPDLSLSLFDLSLPSTSCSMMANLFPDLVPSGSGAAPSGDALAPEAVIDEKMVAANLSELSLSGIFTGLEPFPSPVRPPIDPDVDMTMMSESTVDYIARFQDIAEKFRTEQHHP
ncbi:protein cramped [Anopheles arabiensis]|uniref:protein cramped n=1 Tax=Anopheles arabiensis TaxID=7173 RepID=UPI001AAC7A6D|nr:protein cramped [Anopheles arabiensis]XP_040173489.1 protein cramped [Anopheles arabiensis]XP_040173490.1 protein cramped [Anopheles arabiensis]XP_040173491.1 protein cramped [Anopheles arabiensis]